MHSLLGRTLQHPKAYPGLMSNTTAPPAIAFDASYLAGVISTLAACAGVICLGVAAAASRGPWRRMLFADDLISSGHARLSQGRYKVNTEALLDSMAGDAATLIEGPDTAVEEVGGAE